MMTIPQVMAAFVHDMDWLFIILDSDRLPMAHIVLARNA